MVHCIKNAFLLSHTMNCVTTREQAALELVDIIDFKWLMAHEGHRVHVERLQCDRDYASECLARASASSVVALREAAQRLARYLAHFPSA